MPRPSDEKDKALKTPLDAGERTAPELSGATLELNLTDPALQPLSERFDLLAEIGRGGMASSIARATARRAPKSRSKSSSLRLPPGPT